MLYIQKPISTHHAPVINEGDSFLNESCGLRSMQAGRERSPEFWPGQFLALPCCTCPEEAHAGIAYDIMTADRHLLLMLLYTPSRESEPATLMHAMDQMLRGQKRFAGNSESALVMLHW